MLSEEVFEELCRKAGRSMALKSWTVPALSEPALTQPSRPDQRLSKGSDCFEKLK